MSTMFFGTVSGGLSAELTGGNFWQGAATGLVVSGLNHTMHKISWKKFVSKIDESIVEQGLNPEDPVISEEYAYMREFTESNSVLNDLLKKANETFHVLFRDVFGTPKGGYASYDTKRFVYITKAGKEPTGSSFEIGDGNVRHRVVSIYKSAFLSNRGLALAIGAGLKFHSFFYSYNSVLSTSVFNNIFNKTKEWHYEYSH